MLGKRVHMAGKTGVPSRSSSKGKDMAKSTAARFSKTQVLDSVDGETNNVVFPYFRPADNAECLPCYTSLLNRSEDEGIEMKDLDQLQQELEKLLSASAVRSRLLSSEFELIGKDKERHDKKIKFSDKSPVPKQRKIEEKVKPIKEIKPTFKLAKKTNDEPPKLEVPKVVLPKNDTKSKFWLSVDPFCAAVTRDDVAFIDDLIEECNKDIDMKIPELGQHYADEWSVKLQEQSSNLVVPMPDRDASQNDLCLKKNLPGDSYKNSVIYRLASALLEENGNKLPSIQDKLKDIQIKPPSNNGVCFDKRLRSELVDLGLLDADDDSKSESQDDEIVQEIRLCQQELAALNDHNRAELNRLRNVVNKDLSRQEIVKKLDEVDNKVLDVYNRLSAAPAADKNKIEWEAAKIVQTQKELHMEAMEESSDFIE